MSYNNISAEITSETVEFLIQKIKEMEAKLPFVINLSTEEIRSLPKMGDKTIAFVEKAIEFAVQNPSFLPPFVDVNELKKDLELAKKLKSFINVLEPFSERVTDTYLAVGAEAFMAARVFYTSSKAALQAGLPGANTIVDELGKRFSKRRHDGKETEQAS